MFISNNQQARLPNDTTFDSSNLDPLRKFTSAYETRQFRAAEIALLELDEIYVDKNEILDWAGRIGRHGRKAAADIIIRYLTNRQSAEKLAANAALSALPGLTRYYIVTGQSIQGQSILTHIVDIVHKLDNFQTFTQEQQAIIMNAAQSLCSYNEDFESAQKYNEIVCKLEPAEPIWIANYALTMYRRKDFVKSASIFDTVLAQYETVGKSVDTEILEQGVEIYQSVSQKSGLEHCLRLIELESPEKARVVRDNLAKRSS